MPFIRLFAALLGLFLALAELAVMLSIPLILFGLLAAFVVGFSVVGAFLFGWHALWAMPLFFAGLCAVYRALDTVFLSGPPVISSVNEVRRRREHT
ncbi:MAG: hypothetical protein JJU00_08480 [Opitutales bacterium]|nr:hypothetical protein [Opitutales bacterium]